MTPARDRVALGASAGGVEALHAVLRGLPVDLPAAVFVTIHRAPTASSSLAEVLGRSTSLPVREPRDGDEVRARVVYVAPADHHMIVRDDRIYCVRSPKQHHTRPAIDPMFASLAAAYGPRVIGAVLTGNLDDGVAGLVAVKAANGVSLVQDPEEALFPSMPRSALLKDHVDLVFTLPIAPQILTALVRGDSLDTVRQLGLPSRAS